MKENPPYVERDFEDDNSEFVRRLQEAVAGIEAGKSGSETPPFAKELEEDFGEASAQRVAQPDTRKKKPDLVLPSGNVRIIDTAANLFQGLAKKRRYFARGRMVFEIARNKEGSEVLVPLQATAFRSRMEEEFSLLAWRSPKGEPVLKPSHCPKDIAEALLATNQAIDYSLGIRLLTSSPILVERDGNLVVLNKGYHDADGGVYVEKKAEIRDVSLPKARTSLLELLEDFDFTMDSDRSRAIASFIAPALRFGHLLTADFPLDLSEADVSQSGKTYRQKLVCAIYGERPHVIARRENGVGSLDESISSALSSGRPFILFENVRGFLDSQLLESAIRGHGHVGVRVPHRGEIQLSTENVCWQLSSNQASTTRDLANRSVITRIRKRPASYRYQVYPEGDLLAHVQANHGYYLSCVFTIAREWFKTGKPRTQEFRHDFREWCQVMDWIVQNLFKLPPLLDGHREEQERISNPYLNWLRDVAIAVDQAGRLDEGLRPGELVDLSAQRGVVIPGHSRHDNDDQQTMLAGRILNKLFADAQAGLNVGGYLVRRMQREEYNSERRETRPVSYFWFERLAA
jgi:hypothetical protein